MPYTNRAIQSGVDRGTGASNVIDYEHHEIHAGSHFYISGVEDLSSSHVFDVQFTTPNTDRWTHLTFNLACESETLWYIYEGATIETAGTTITPLNNDRNSTRSSVNIVKSIKNSSIENANADTVVSSATQLATGIIGSGRRSLGADSREKELILKQNTIYCFRAIASSAGYIDFLMTWYEHINKA